MIKGRRIFLQPFFFMVRRLVFSTAVAFITELMVQVWMITAITLVKYFIIGYVKPHASNS